MPLTLALSMLLAQTGSSHVETFMIDGIERKVTIVVGPGAVPREGAPVVFAFHGHGGNMRYSARKFDMRSLWPEAIAVYPEGIPTKGKTDPQGTKNGWQQNVKDEGGRDIKFFDAMLAQIRKEYKVDNRRIYTMGHSNGGRFTYVLWEARPNVFAAYGPAASPAGLGARNYLPTSAFVVAGEKDPIVKFVGQKFSIKMLEHALHTDSSKATTNGYAKYEPGINGTELGTYIHPGGHEYPAEAFNLTIEFFKRHSKQR